MDSEMDTPFSVTLAIWYWRLVSQMMITMEVCETRLIQTPCIAIEKDEKTLFQDSLSFLFGERILTPLYRLTK